MHAAADKEQLRLLAKDLKTDCPLPHRSNVEQLHIAYSHVFRQLEDAMRFAKYILLNPGETLVGGHTTDSIGDLWWIGVRIHDLNEWRAKGGYHRVALRDPEVPENEML